MAATGQASDQPWSSQEVGVQSGAKSRHLDNRTAGKMLGHKKMQAAELGVADDKGSVTWHQRSRLEKHKVAQRTYGNGHPYKAESGSCCRAMSGWDSNYLERRTLSPIRMAGDFLIREWQRH